MHVIIIVNKVTSKLLYILCTSQCKSPPPPTRERAGKCGDKHQILLVFHSPQYGESDRYCFLACKVGDRLSKVRGSWFLEATDFCHPQARQIHRCIFAPVTSVNAHYYSVLTTPFDMVNAHYFIIDFRAKFFIKIQNQASDTSRSLPSFSSAPFLLRAVPSERLGQV